MLFRSHLDELSFDPRAHDHFHPVNKRPNVLFGEWDPHTIDGRGFYRRFVLRQMTLDTLLTWVSPQGEPAGAAGYSDPAERLFEAAAVLAGTILMGAGVSGSGPAFHDSTVTLSKLPSSSLSYRRCHLYTSRHCSICNIFYTSTRYVGKPLIIVYPSKQDSLGYCHP